MITEYSRVTYYAIAAVGVVIFIQGLFAAGNRLLSDDHDLAKNPLITWPGWFRRIFYICVGTGVFMFALWKLWRR